MKRRNLCVVSLIISVFVVSCGLELNIASASTTDADRWGVYAEKTADGQNLSCWVCSAKSAGKAKCLGNILIPGTDWDTAEQAKGSACVLLKNGKCAVLQNENCKATSSLNLDKPDRK